VLSANTRSRNGLPDRFSKDISWVDIRWVDDCIESGCLIPARRILSPNKIIQSQPVMKPSVDLPELKSNDLLIAELAKRMDYHRLKKNKYKYIAYRKAIQSITDCGEIINSREQANKLPNVGKSISEKVCF
jgi:hypothetical protein